MKRAVCVLGGIVLALTTTAFATPTSVDIPMPNAVYSNTVSSGFNTSGGTISWLQPFSFAPTAPDLSAYPVGGTLTLTAGITSAKMTIVANNISSPAGWSGDIDTFAIQNPVTSTWETLNNNKLTPLSVPYIYGPTTTSYAWGSATGTYGYPLTGTNGIDWLVNATGFNAKVTMTQYAANSNDTVSSSKLDATTTYKWTYTYDVPDPPAPVVPVPAPAALLLASMGAGLVSWLRARRAL